MSKYFTEDEFKCECSANDGAGCGMDIDRQVKALLHDARELAQIPFTIKSGARCESHNRKVGGSKDSSHLKGVAVDIKATTSRERYEIVNALIQVGFTRIGIAKTFIHCDLDRDKPQQLIWVY